ncbi:MAG: hypothetical protein EOO38_05260 [Cytophagaceae bacterium]|nr:MAG: hypothetical protein EOO38_05260 [Cytophagaceae bacterium]
MLRDRVKLIYELRCVVTSLNLSERKSAIIAYNDKKGMQAVEAIRLLGQLRAEGEVYTLVEYLNLQAPVVPSKTATFFDVYPTAGALAQIGVASLDSLLIPDPTQVIDHHDPALETQLIAAIVQKVLGHKIGIAYAEERLSQMDAGKARTRLAGIVKYLKTHTARQIEMGNVPIAFTD